MKNRSFALGLLAVGVPVVLAACGGSQKVPQPGAPADSKAAQGTPRATPPPLNLTDEDQIKSTIRQFDQAELKGDGATACSQMDSYAQQKWLDQWNANPNVNPKFTSCAELFNSTGTILKGLSPQQQQTFLNPTFASVSVTGDVAQVNWIDDLGTYNQLMKREGGTWKMSAYNT